MESVAVRPQTRSDRTIGVVYLLYFVAAIGATLLGKGLLSPNDPAATASAMLAHESLYRASLAADLIANALYIGVIALLYSLFAPVSQRLSVVAAFFGLVGCSVQIFGSTFRMASLFLLGSNGWLSSFTAEQVHSAALLCLRLHVLTFNTSLVLFGLFNLCIGCLIFGSKLLPKFLGVLMLAAGLGWSTFIWPPLATALSSYIMPLGGTGGTSTNAVAIGPGCEKRSLTPLSGGRLTAGYAIGKPPLMSNVSRRRHGFAVLGVGA